MSPTFVPFVWWSLGAMGILISSYYCFSYGSGNSFSSLGTFSISLIEDPVLRPMNGWEHPFCIREALEDPLSRQLYQVPVSQHLLGSTQVSEFGDCIWDGSPGGAVYGW